MHIVHGYPQLFTKRKRSKKRKEPPTAGLFFSSNGNGNDHLKSGQLWSYKPGAPQKSLRNNLLSADFDTLREMVRRFVKGIAVLPDKRAEMTWDPQAVLSLADGPRVPATAMMVMKNGCGGPNYPVLQPLLDVVILPLPDPKSKQIPEELPPALPPPRPLTLPDHIVQMFAVRRNNENPG